MKPVSRKSLLLGGILLFMAVGSSLLIFFIHTARNEQPSQPAGDVQP